VRRFGFRTQLFLAFSLLIASVALFFAVYFPLRGATAADAALKVRAATVASVMANLVAASVEFDQGKDAEVQLASVRNDQDLVYIAVYKLDGSLFARYSKKVPSETLEPPAHARVGRDSETDLRGEFLQVRVPLLGGGNQVGSLVAGFSRRSVLEERSRLLWTALLLSFSVLVGGIALALLITKPLLRVASELLSAAREQEASMAQGAAEVEETRRTMDLLVGSAQQIADRCSAVLANAESTLSGTRHITECINELNVHAEKVAELLATIMQVADRTDLLALNAALEGTRAGEAGRGFTLVAAEMRRLAENVMESVASIRKLMKDVRSTSQKAVQASHDGTQLSEETTRSAREIALVTQQQRKATEQVRTSMDEMTDLLNHTMRNIKQTTREAAALAGLAAGDRLPPPAPTRPDPAAGRSPKVSLPPIDLHTAEEAKRGER
jgi:type II secretory pathway component PulM